jgi:hypothetical protein
MFGREAGGTSSNGNGWVVVARRVTGPTYTQHHLSPDVSYTFLVRAENSHGVSPPSPPSEPAHVAPDDTTDLLLKEARNSLLAGHIVELTHIQPLSSTSIKIVWEVSIVLCHKYEQFAFI